MNIKQRKTRKPSRCSACGRDVRRGALIAYIPRDAKPGQPRTWLHARCWQDTEQ